MLSRRDLLHFGGVAGIGLMLPGFLLSGCSSSQASAVYEAARQDAQRIAAALFAQGEVSSLGIALTSADRLVWADTMGNADPQRGLQATPSTLFGVASVTKVMTAVAVLQLAERNTIRLDDLLVQYLRDFRMADERYRSITVGMLINHSAGFPGSNYINYITSRFNPRYPSELLTALRNERLKAAPGAACIYGNDAYSLAGLLIQAVTGMSYDGYVQTHILAPLGMQLSCFPQTPLADGSFARACIGGISQPQEYSNSFAAGGLYTTPSDLAAFARMLLNQGASDTGQILSAASVERMALDQTIGTFTPIKSPGQTFGLGWDSIIEPGLAAVGVRGWTKNGGSLHYGAQILVAPDAGLAVVVMGTSGKGYDPLAVSQRILLRALTESQRISLYPSPVSPQMLPAVAAPDGLLADIKGVYANYENINLIKVTGDVISTFTLQRDGFREFLNGYRYRTDGWFTADDPRYALKFIEDGSWYLAFRIPAGNGHYLDQFAQSQQVKPIAELPAAWKQRMERERNWLIVNETPDSLFLLPEQDPRFRLATYPDLGGLLVAWQTIGGFPALLDPSGSATTARMTLLIPGGQGKDLNDLDVVEIDGEEWLRWGGWLHRPFTTVPVVAAGATVVTIGAAGYAEWRAVPSGGLQRKIIVSGGYAWRCHGFTPTSCTLLGKSENGPSAVILAGVETGYLALYGSPGDRISLTVT